MQSRSTLALKRVKDPSSNADRNNEKFGDEHWGSEGQKASLVCTCCDALSAALSVSGGFMTMQNRELIESISSTAIAKLGIDGARGISSIVTPWPDGAASGLVQGRQACFILRESLESGMETAREDILKSKIIERDTQEKKKKKKEVENKKKEVMESEKGQAAYERDANAQVPEVSVRDNSRGPLSPILDDVLLEYVQDATTNNGE
eukprot:scaffold3172_cov275-Chaetoceros_neogracile.AAC.4